MFSFRGLLTLEFLQLSFSVHLLHVLQHHPYPLLTHSAASLFKKYSHYSAVQHCLIVIFPIQDIVGLKKTQSVIPVTVLDEVQKRKEEPQQNHSNFAVVWIF